MSENAASEIAAAVQAGVINLTSALEASSTTVLEKLCQLERSIARLESAVSHSAIDLRLLSHSVFVENLAHEQASAESAAKLPEPRAAAEAQPGPAPGPSQEAQPDALDQLHASLVQVPEPAPLALPHIYATDAYMQDSDLGINFWSKHAVPGNEAPSQSDRPAGQAWMVPDFQQVMVSALEGTSSRSHASLPEVSLADALAAHASANASAPAPPPARAPSSGQPRAAAAPGRQGSL